MTSALVAGAWLFLSSPAVTQSEPLPALGEPVEVACAPRLAPRALGPAPQVLGSTAETSRRYFGPSDSLVINRGGSDGLEVGQEYFVRRRVLPVGSGSEAPAVLHTRGWVRITTVEPESSVAEVLGVCDALQRGDVLQPLVWPAAFAVHDSGEPDYEGAGTILFGLDGRSLLGESDYFVLNLGETAGIAPGQRLTVFRRRQVEKEAASTLGEAVAVVVEDESTTARMIQLVDIVEAGDLVAPQR